MVGRRVLGGVLLGVVVLCGCAPKPLTGKPVDLHAEMGSRSERPAPEVEAAPPALGPEVPYVPLVEPPRVQRVWIPAYLNDAGDLVSGHWVYLMLEGSRWFLEDPGEGRQQRQLNLRLPGPSLVITPQQLQKMAPEDEQDERGE